MKNPFEIPNKPSALAMRDFEGPDSKEYCWEDWGKEAKEKYPIRYFLSETLPLWFYINISDKISHAFYWLRSNTYKRRHFLDLRQPKTGTLDDYNWGYIESSSRILYACFNSLILHVEELESCSVTYSVLESIQNHREELWNSKDPDGTGMIGQLHTFEEMLDLCEYWTDRRKVELKGINDLLHTWYLGRHSDDADKLMSDLRSAEEKFDAEELENLTRLMRIRKNLWV